MQFLDLSREYSKFDWKKSIEKVFDSFSFINGSVVKEFESKIAEYIGCKYAIGVSSGTDALLVSMMAISKTDPVVLTTPYTFIATTEVPFRMGAKVIFCDIDDTFNIDINKVKEVIRKRKIDIFIPVHLFGNAVVLDDELLSMCKERDIYIIEDACQAMGTRIKNKHVGTFGNIGCFSFFPAKNLGCAGDGGLITTDSEELYKKCLMIRNHGSSVKYDNEVHGGNFRLDTLQASILLDKIPLLDNFIENRRQTSDKYNIFFQNIEFTLSPAVKKEIYHSYNQYVLRINNRRADLIKYLNSKSVPTALYYPRSLDEQTCYRGIDFHCDCQNARKASLQNLAIPIAHLIQGEIELICKCFGDFYKNYGWYTK